jgi:hypothetical protein
VHTWKTFRNFGTYLIQLHYILVSFYDFLFVKRVLPVHTVDRSDEGEQWTAEDLSGSHVAQFKITSLHNPWEPADRHNLSVQPVAWLIFEQRFPKRILETLPRGTKCFAEDT